MDFLGGLISAGASIFNSAQNRSATAAANDQNAQSNFNFATHSVDWKAGDAVQAEKDFGINRLVGMGVQPSAQPAVAVGSTDNNLSNAGQSIGRAVAAMAPQKLRAAELENKLLEAKIHNIDTDTIKNRSDIMNNLGSPGTPPAYPVASPQPPYPTADPRGPVINLEQRARDRDGSIVLIPSEKSSSPLQTGAAAPTNFGMAARAAGDYVSSGFGNLWGAAGRAVSDYNRMVTDPNAWGNDRNTVGY